MKEGGYGEGWGRVKRRWKIKALAPSEEGEPACRWWEERGGRGRFGEGGPSRGVAKFVVSSGTKCRIYGYPTHLPAVVLAVTAQF